MGDEGIDVFEAPEAQRWVSGLLTKLVETNAEAALGSTHRESILFHSFLSVVTLCPHLIGSSLRHAFTIYQQEFHLKLLTFSNT